MIKKSLGIGMVVSVSLISPAHVHTSTYWELVCSNVLSGSSPPVTNIVVRRISAEALREDVSPELSVLFFPSNQAQVLLNHPSKTFVRHHGHAERVLTNSHSVPVTIRERAAYGGTPADVHRWTNGPASGLLWVGSAAPYLRGNSNASTTVSPPDIVPFNLSVGSFVGSNHIVLATEHTTLAPVWEHRKGTNVPILLSNMTMTTHSTLVSVTETNFPPSVFQIPADYTEVSSLEQPPEPVKFNPAVFGREPTGSNFTRSIRQRYEKGRPLLELPKTKPADYKVKDP